MQVLNKSRGTPPAQTDISIYDSTSPRNIKNEKKIKSKISPKILHKILHKIKPNIFNKLILPEYKDLREKLERQETQALRIK